jgi:hypothetical protein
LELTSAYGKKNEAAKELQNFLAKHGNSKWKARLDTDKASRKYGIVEVE